MARVIWSDGAKRDYRQVVQWIARDSLNTAEIWADKIYSAPLSLERFPESGAPVEEDDFPGLRELLVYPYRIIYKYSDGVCEILHVIHGSRDIRRILRRDILP